MSKSLSHLSDEATQRTNDTGVRTPILEINPSNGTFFRFNNRVPQGSVPGIPVYMKLRDTNGNALPTDTEVLFRAERPGDNDATAVSVKQTNIASWNEISGQDQRNADNVDAVKVRLTSSKINIRDSDTLYVEINSSAVVDWANSELYFAREGVDELPVSG